MGVFEFAQLNKIGRALANKMVQWLERSCVLYTSSSSFTQHSLDAEKFKPKNMRNCVWSKSLKIFYLLFEN